MDVSSHDPVQLVCHLKSRCEKLYERMSRNPDRPHWEFEYLSILIQVMELLSLLSTNLASTALNLEEVYVRVASLETRYSELLYKVSSRV